MRSFFRGIRRFIFISFLTISLFFNIALIASTTLYNAATSVMSTLTGHNHPARKLAKERARLVAELEGEKQLNRGLRSEIADANANLVVERQARRKALEEANDISSQLALAKISRSKLRDEVSAVSRSVALRTTKTASRATASMAGEAIPFWGAAVIVTATSWELYDLCQTAKDMNNIQKILDPEIVQDDEEPEVCGITVPSRQALLEAVSTAPGKAWSASREAMPTLEDVRNFDIPWSEWAAGAKAKSGSMWSGAKQGTANGWNKAMDWLHE
jgi:hypothetical protein